MIKENIETFKKLNRDYTKAEFDRVVAYFGDTVPIKLLEDVRKYYTAKSQKIITEDLLEDMNELDITLFENDSCKVVIKTKVNTKMLDKEKLHTWFMDNGYQDFIKETLAFPKGELTTEIVDYINESGHTYLREGVIAPASVKKVISDRLKAGEEIPNQEVLKVTYFDLAEVKFK